jgi:hypothetical protein
VYISIGENTMSWKKEILITVRTFINDLGPNYTFSDSRLLQTIVVGAQYVQFDVNLDNKYTINIVTPNITPDPTLLDPKDDIFSSLVALKAACIIDQSSFRTKAVVEGIRAALGPASLSISNNNLSGLKVILEKGPCALYETLTNNWDISNATAVRAIFSPFVGNNFDPQNLNNPSYDYSRHEDNQFY